MSDSVASRRRSFIPLAIPNVGEREALLASSSIREGWISSVGPRVKEFEESVRRFVGGKSAVAVTSGTAALHLSLHMMELRPEEEVVMPSLTFIAPANAIRYQGAWPVFVDVDRSTWQVSPDAILTFLQGTCERRSDGVWNLRTGRRIRGILPVHLLGHPAPMVQIRQIAQEWGLFLVEDAAEALGAVHPSGSPVGGTGALVCFSFNGNKVISTGGGGMIVTDQLQLGERARFLSTQAKSDAHEYVHSEVGFNYRLTNVQAAIGVAQMERLPEFLARKSSIHAAYRAAFEPFGLAGVQPAPGAGCSHWLSTFTLPHGVNRIELSRRLREANIEVRPLWQPLHRSPAMRGSYAERCPCAEDLYDRALSLPSSTSITDEELDRVCVELIRLLRDAV